MDPKKEPADEADSQSQISGVSSYLPRHSLRGVGSPKGKNSNNNRYAGLKIRLEEEDKGGPSRDFIEKARKKKLEIRDASCPLCYEPRLRVDWDLHRANGCDGVLLGRGGFARTGLLPPQRIP